MAGSTCEFGVLFRNCDIDDERFSSLVNNAGICTEANNPQPIDEVDEDAFDAHLRINSRGAFLGCKYAIQQMKKQDLHPCGLRGWIVNFASMVANIGMAGLSMFDLRTSLEHFLTISISSWLHCLEGSCCCHD